jgi:hypothetical protein
MEDQPAQPAHEPDPAMPEAPVPAEVPAEPAPEEDDDESADDDEADGEPVQLRSFEELDSLADRGELTKESLQEELNKYVEAFQQEYETASQEQPENVEEFTRDFFKKNVPAAAAQIVWLANAAESENVRASMSKYVIEAAMATANADGDPIKELLSSLSKNDATSPAATP